MKILVLGSRGMLGQMCEHYFRKTKHEVVNDSKKFNNENIFEKIKEINSLSIDVVINCIGKIPQKEKAKFFFENTVLPHILAEQLENNILFVQPSTDCVFSGKKDYPYETKSHQNAIDNYGISKAIAEKLVLSRKNSLVVRTSIIGPDKNSKAGLLEWVMSSKNKKIDGYMNHYWSGITTLEWCYQVHQLLENGTNGLFQIGIPEGISKFTLIKNIIDIFDIECNLNPINHTKNVNKSLIPDIICKPIEDQLSELSKCQFYQS